MSDIPDISSDHTDDRAIIESVLKGNKDDFRYIIHKYERRIRAYTSKFLGYHQQNIEDVTSEVFIKVYTNLAKYNPKLKFSSWIYRIAHNEAINYSKKNNKHLSVDIQNQDWRMGYTIDFDRPRKEDIEKILQQLSPNDKNLLLLFYIEELSIREISEILKTTENSIKSRLSQARKKAQKIATK